MKTPAIGCELRATGATVKINDVICGATNELALAADSHFVLECLTSTEWVARGYDSVGDPITPLTPDIR
ncbi:hypothetical protein LCGC14_2618730 [marine sediment metagenome]|uniref:Uncharacterized protein n=1 Tax=marine sediment metagenome TaxID=412755 RepID=A0A0F9ARA6_9ZZZZ